MTSSRAGSAAPLPDPELTATERALYGALTTSGLRAFLGGWTRTALGGAITRIRFRAGRIDAVWGVDLDDGRAVVVKTHRPPADPRPIEAAHDAQRVLAEAGFPAALPLAGPDQVAGHVLTAETLMPGAPPAGRDPHHRRVLAEGLARHVEILRGHRELMAEVGPGPSWCRYHDGPWPVPHDPIVDFRTTPEGYEWLDAFALRAARQILAHRDPDAVVLGHADWYAGNAAITDGVLVGTFDWELVADAEAVIAGFAAACYAASPTAGGGLSTPAEARAFLQDYDAVRSRPSTAHEQRAAAGAVAWILAFNARWQVALVDHGLGDERVVALVRDHGEEYLALAW